MKSSSYDIGAWVYSKTGKLVKITAHDMPGFTYEDIERDAEPNEIPEFSVDINPGDNLNKDNFWHLCMERCPLACNLFCLWIDKFKMINWPIQGRQMNWDVMFGNNTPTEQKIKFHDIPFEMQYGIILSFFNDFEIPYDVAEYADWGDRASVVAGIIDTFVDIEVDQRNGKVSEN